MHDIVLTEPALIRRVRPLKREPDNTYDESAIRVDNVNHQQIGHIPRRISEKLVGRILPASVPLLY
jgi:hypothetical protein